jgi:PAS domain S-box-containing protein
MIELAKKYFKSEEDLEELLRNFDENVIVSESDLNGFITYVSSAFCEISGFSKEEIIGRPHNIVRHKDMSKSAFKDLWNTIKNGKTWKGEVKNRKKDGSFYWVKAVISPKIRNGETVGYISIRQDITFQKEIERLKIESEENQRFLDLLLNSLDQVIVVTDGSRIKRANRKFFEFFEIYTLQDFYNLGYNCICNTFENRDGFLRKQMGENEWSDYILSNRDKENFVLIKRDNLEFIFSVSVITIFVDNELLYIAVFLDVTNQRKKELELIEHKKLISDSIEYASYIQNAILPDTNILNSFAKESFVIWKPRDKVGGDIFFADKISENELLIIVADCTSHGVPGAFISMIVKAIQNQLLTDINFGRLNPSMPNRVLEYFNKNMKKILNQYEKNSSNSNVGFDGAVLYYNKINGSIVYSGAETPLYYIEYDEVKMTKYDRHSIGYTTSRENYIFKNYFFSDLTTKSFYLTTDGFYDQVGEKKRMMFGKKRVAKLINEIKDEPMLLQREIFIDKLEEFQGSEVRRDDVTFIGLKF